MKGRYIFNTGRHYGPEGQIIVIDEWDVAEHVYMMNDLTRGICRLYQLYDLQDMPEVTNGMIAEMIMWCYDNNIREYPTIQYDRFNRLRDGDIDLSKCVNKKL